MIGQQSLFPPPDTVPLRQRVEVQIVTAADARYALVQWHYLHRVRTGRQLNYGILIDGIMDGIITYAYPSGANVIMGCEPGETVEFARLYLRSNIPHTASCAIAKTLHRIASDWARLFPDAKPLRLVVSWSDQTRHKGTIYKAANFQWAGESPGAAAGGLRKGHKRWGERGRYTDLGNTKDRWVYWLCPPSKHST